MVFSCVLNGLGHRVREVWDAAALAPRLVAYLEDAAPALTREARALLGPPLHGAWKPSREGLEAEQRWSADGALALTKHRHLAKH